VDGLQNKLNDFRFRDNYTHAMIPGLGRVYVIVGLAPLSAPTRRYVVTRQPSEISKVIIKSCFLAILPRSRPGARGFSNKLQIGVACPFQWQRSTFGFIACATCHPAGTPTPTK